MKRVASLLSILFLFASCEYDFKPDIDVEKTLYAIEGDILIGRWSYFTVTKVVPMSSDSFVDQNQVSATFRVEDDEGVVYKQEESEQINKAAIDLTGASDKRKYRLVVEIDTESSGTLRYASSWMAAEPAPSVDVRVEKQYLNTNIYLTLGGSSGYYRWEYERLIKVPSILVSPSFEYIPDTGEVVGKEAGWWPYSLCWGVLHPGVSTIYSSEMLSADSNEERKVFTLTSYEVNNSVSIRVLVRSLSEGAYKYLNALNKGSEISGSLLAPLPGETVGNIINLDDPSDYAVGYISVCNCAVYYVQKDVKVSPQYNFAADYVIEVEKGYYQSYYDKGYVPFDSENRWVPYRCVDCRLKGYSIKKPADWD